MRELDNMNTSDFVYTASIKLNELRHCKAQTDFPKVADLSITSRNFNSYSDCASSVKNFMGDVLDNVNAGDGDKYVISIEANPAYSGVETKSGEWHSGELARLWLFDAAQEDSVSIYAVGQARVYMVPREPDQYIN